ncbi:hypothetical protein [Nocardioides sp.]|uniref:hypothetical protein n=1 Tax=Nocardioides sp. TaxID=35761 RepID=UPI00286D7CBF|nr:hypothetical protein [Nocardioides sp.]
MRAVDDQGWSVRLALLTGVLVAATLLGAWRVSGSGPDREDPATLKLGDATLVVTHVERVTGLTADDLGGMTHGIQGLVPADQTMLRVSVVLTAGTAAADYDPSDLWIERAGTGRAIGPVGGALGRGSLSARASISGAVSFVVPRSGARYVLHAAGTGGSIPLGQVDEAPPGTGHTDDHGDDGTQVHEGNHDHPRAKP